jgi:hypothetical protein
MSQELYRRNSHDAMNGKMCMFMAIHVPWARQIDNTGRMSFRAIILNENMIGNKEKSWSGSAGDQRAGKTAKQHQVSFDLRHSDNPSFVVHPLPERSHGRPQRPWCTSSWVTRTHIISNNIASSLLFVRLGRRARAFHVGHRRRVSSIHYLYLSSFITLLAENEQSPSQTKLYYAWFYLLPPTRR